MSANYFRNTSTGKVWAVSNGQVTEIPQSSVPPGTVMSQGNFSYSDLVNQYASTPQQQTLPQSQGGAVQNAPAPNATPPGYGQNVIPDSVYASYRQAVASGLPPAEAEKQLKSLVSSGTYSGVFDPAKFYTSDLTYRDPSGAVYGYDPKGNQIRKTTSVQQSVAGPNGFQNSTQNVQGPVTGGISTGDPKTDALTQAVLGLLNQWESQGQVVNPNKPLDPSVLNELYNQAASELHPYFAQQLNQMKDDLTRSVTNYATQYKLNTEGTVAKFQQDLASERNTAGNQGVAFSGQRGLNEQNLALGVNRQLESQASQTAANIGDATAKAAAFGGPANISAPPPLTVQNVSLEGARGGSYDTGRSLNFGYNPESYPVGSNQYNESNAIYSRRNDLYNAQQLGLANNTRSFSSLLNQ